MKAKYIATLAIASLVSLGSIYMANTSRLAFNPQVAQANPCAGNPCAAKPAANPCAGNPCAAKGNPCASANPCAGNPCAAKPAANPCAGNPCASSANPCAGNPCASKAAKGSAPQVFTDPKANNNLAIRGYDPVAYFTAGKPVKGKEAYKYTWKGAVWQFSSPANLAKFRANPTAFAPQYGGYCAKAVSEGSIASTVPEAWKIVDGKLYLNYSQDVQKQWSQDIPGNIKKANARWPQILKTAGVVHYDTVGAVKY
jgi:YHS domain-containing protein